MLRYVIRKRRLPASCAWDLLKLMNPSPPGRRRPTNTTRMFHCCRPSSSSSSSSSSICESDACLGRRKRPLNTQRTYVSATTPVCSTAPSGTTTSSNASAAAAMSANYRELLRWTAIILDPLKTPLGTMNDATWDNVFAAMQVWLNAATARGGENGTGDGTIIPRHVDTVDRLLTRLLYEHSLVPPKSFLDHNNQQQQHDERWQQQHDHLVQYMLRTMRAWLQVSTRFPHAPMAVKKAQRLFTELNHDDNDAWNDGTTNTNATSTSDFVNLVRAHLRLTKPGTTIDIRSAACQQAADMLLSETCLWQIIPELAKSGGGDDNDQQLTEHLKECYQNALRQSLEVASALQKKGAATNIDDEMNATINGLTDTASAIMEQMNELTTRQPGWEDVRPDATEMNRVLDALFLDKTGKQKKKTLSKFEQAAIQERILVRINQADSRDDQEKVEELVQFWRSNMNSEQEKDVEKWKPFAQATVNFYLRIQDVVQATQWLQRLEQIPTAEEIQSTAVAATTTSDVAVVVDDTDGSSLEEKDAAIASITSDDAAAAAAAVGGEDIVDYRKKKMEELAVVNSVFVANQQERVKQKINLLDIWVAKRDLPEAPWRATEILESIESEEGVTLDSNLYVTVVKLWLHGRGTVGVLGEQALPIAMRCPKFDAEILSLMIQILIKEDNGIGPRSKGPNRTAVAVKMADLLKERWEEFPEDQVHILAANVVQLLSRHQRSLKVIRFLQHMLDQGVPLSERLCEHAIQSLAPRVSSDIVQQLIDLLESSGKKQDPPVQLNFQCYVLALHRLLEGRGAVQMRQSKAMLERILDMVRDGQLKVEGNQVSQLLYSAMQFASMENPGSIRDILLLAEQKLLQNPSPGVRSPIALDLYQKVAKFFVEKGMVKEAKHLFNRLKQHHRDGFLDLHPDREIYRFYFAALQRSAGKETLDIRIKLLNELIGLYEASNKENEHYKPAFEMFDGIFYELKWRNNVLTSKATKNNRDLSQIERDAKTAILLMTKMHSLNVTPHDLKRPFVFNTAMELVLSCPDGKENHYSTVIRIKKQMEEMGAKPNLQTLIAILRACERASKNQPYKACATMVEMLTQIRMLGKADGRIYMSCFRTLLVNAQRLRPAELDKIAASVFECCCEDGVLTAYAKKSLRRLSSPQTFYRLYQLHVLEGGKEPDAWTRNNAETYF